uniref:Holliday junction resolvase YqgF n=1 Tax=Paulinella chromatophora TaxID=39717 RepID=B1X3P6_PAUCH|nr:Holliday junction resolvase YqgF [Paulinella chromatophora]ACB42565.1 Holliday junction resolvase YqgF [Paulinella chromatophora]
MNYLSQPCSILCLDVGRYRIGMAGCDSLYFSISLLPALHRNNFETDLLSLKYLISERSVEALVIGIPLNDLAQITKQAIYCRRYGKHLAQTLRLPVAWVNENGSTWSTSDQYKIYNDKSGRLDSMVAALLLEQWIKERNKS